jgi:hypothetical protein
MAAGLGGIIAGAGAKGVRAVDRARTGYHDVAREAIRVKGAAEAQALAHEHTLKTLHTVHKMAGQGTDVSLDIHADGRHNIGYTKKNIGENFGEVQEKAAIKDFKGSRKPSTQSHDERGFRTETPNHYEDAKTAAIEGTPNRLALPAGKGLADTPRVNGAIPMGTGKEEAPAEKSDADKIKEQSNLNPKQTAQAGSTKPGFDKDGKITHVGEALNGAIKPHLDSANARIDALAAKLKG